MTVTKLARAAGLSRSTVLYYESIGLLRKVRRSPGNYRVYGDADASRLRQICIYRAAGLTLADVRKLLDRPASGFASILERRLAQLGEEMERLRSQQLAIARLLQTKGKGMLSKEKWTKIMQDSGFSGDDMRRWHAQFERSEPEDHEQFLKFLHIPEAEVKTIREWSRTYEAPSR
jgi:MerR family transcriptional regulator, thiopeptide resistance regulator